MSIEWVRPGESLEYPILDPARLGDAQLWVLFNIACVPRAMRLTRRYVKQLAERGGRR